MPPNCVCSEQLYQRKTLTGSTVACVGCMGHCWKGTMLHSALLRQSRQLQQGAESPRVVAALQGVALITNYAVIALVFLYKG
jgi:hypothetical protein